MCCIEFEIQRSQECFLVLILFLFVIGDVNSVDCDIFLQHLNKPHISALSPSLGVLPNDTWFREGDRVELKINTMTIKVLGLTAHHILPIFINGHNTEDAEQFEQLGSIVFAHGVNELYVGI